MTDYTDLLNEYIYYRIYNLMCFSGNIPSSHLTCCRDPAPSLGTFVGFFCFLFFLFCFWVKQIQLVFIKVEKDYKTNDVKSVHVEFYE